MSFLSQLLQDVKEAVQHTARGETLVSNPDLTRFQRMVQRYVRVFFLVARWDVLKQLKLHAQALTYDTLLAIVPLLAVIFSIVKGLGLFGFDQHGRLWCELQPLDLVQVHEPDNIIPARLQGHLLHLELLFFDQITQLSQHLTPVQEPA